MRITAFNKAIVGALALLLTLVADAVADDVIDATEGQSLFINLVSIVVGVWGVWRVPNTKTPVTPPSRHDWPDLQ